MGNTVDLMRNRAKLLDRTESTMVMVLSQHFSPPPGDGRDGALKLAAQYAVCATALRAKA